MIISSDKSVLQVKAITAQENFKKTEIYLNPISTGLFISLHHWGGGGESFTPPSIKFDPDIL